MRASSPGVAPRFRIAPVGADRQPGRDDASVFEPRPYGAGAEIVSRNPGRNALDASRPSDRGADGVGHLVVFDVPAERVEPDFRRLKFNRTRRE